MTVKRIKEIVCNVIVRMQKPYYQGVAAELAFFFLLSMVPLFTILGEFLGVFSISMDLIKELISQYVSQEVVENIQDYLQYTPSGTFSIFFILFAIWAASKAQYSMIRIANYTYTGLNSGKGFVHERLRAMYTVIITILLLVFSLAILVYGEQLVEVTGLYVENILGLPFNFNQLWYALRWPLGIAVYFLAISFIYYTLPSKKIHYKKLLPGSILTSAGMLLSTWIYSYYTSQFSNHDILYGSLAAVVGLLFWFYILGYVMVIGIVFNAALEETK
jgi:membrane protein